MSQPPSTNPALTASLEFWTRLWQQQIEQSLKLWAVWAQALPHESARDLSAEADALKSRKG